MQHYHPVSRVYVTQTFGARQSVYRQFGLKGHNGIDYRVRFAETPKGHVYVYPSAPGVVSEVVNQGGSGYGLYVRVVHDDGSQTIYGHMTKVYVKKGQKVGLGTILSLSGNSGFSTGAHLHYGYRPPNWLNKHYNNGFKGYVDNLPTLKDRKFIK